MKLFFVLIVMMASFGFAEDFSIYPLTPEPLEFSTQLEPYSTQYIYPDETTLYRMQFVEPDLTTELSMYTLEPTITEPELELEFPEP